MGIRSLAPILLSGLLLLPLLLPFLRMGCGVDFTHAR